MSEKKLTVSIPPGAVFSWESQACQHPDFGKPGLTIWHVHSDMELVEPDPDRADDLQIVAHTWRDYLGRLHGIAYWYDTTTLLETRGNVNIFVDPAYQRRGIGLLLLDSVIREHPEFDVYQQRYTDEGARLVAAWLDRKVRRLMGEDV